MEVPPLASVEGAYWYLIALILLLALLSAVYLVGAILGYFPDPTGLVSLVPTCFRCVQSGTGPAHTVSCTPLP